MPFKSEAQRRYLWLKHPKLAKRWAHEYPGQHALPYHVGDDEEPESKEAQSMDNVLIRLGAATGRFTKAAAEPGSEPMPSAAEPPAGSPPSPAAPAGGGMGGMLDSAVGAAKALPGQAMGAMQAVPGKLQALLQALQANPGRAALLGLGGAGVGYGLHSLLQKKPEEKTAFLKHASEVMRHNSRVIFTRYLDKLASLSTEPTQRQAINLLNAGLVEGLGIHQAMRRAFPKMAAERRGVVVSRLAKRAMDDFTKQGMESCHEKTFSGKPQEGHAWMRKHAEAPAKAA
jgi:hypothetical protein